MVLRVGILHFGRRLGFGDIPSDLDFRAVESTLLRIIA
jgi:hypothetical protein